MASTATERDLEMLEAVAGWDPLDATSYRGDVPAISRSLDAGVDGIRVGVVTELTGEGIDAEVLAATRAAVDRLADAGAEVVELSLPAIEYALSAYYLIAPAECSANLARFDGVRYGLRVDGSTSEEMMARTRAEGFGPEVTRRILLGTYALSAGYYDAFYGQAQRVRTLLRRDFSAAYERVDVLVSSQFARAIETAEIIAPALGLDVTVDEGFGEHDPGPEIDGMTFVEFVERYGQPDWNGDPHAEVFPGG